MAKRDEACRNCRQIFLLKENTRYQKRLPFLLKCGHTLCGVCISAAARKAKDVISCPDCGSKTPYNSAESTEEQLVPNIHILGLVAARHLSLKCTPRQSVWNRSPGEETSKDGSGVELTPNAAASEEKKCDECITRTAEKKCIQCDGFFCDTCFKIIHATANTLRRHKAIPAYQAAVPPPTCSVHFSHLSYYCQTDKVAVCPDCIIHSHKEHDVVALEDAAGAFREEFQALIGDAESVISAIKAKKQEVKARVQEVHKRGLVVCGSMEQQMRDLYTALQKRELVLHQQLDQNVELQAAKLCEIESALDADTRRVSEVLLQVRHKIKSDVTLLQNTAQLRDSLKAVKDIVVKDLPCIKHSSFQLTSAVRDALNMAGEFQMTDSSSSIAEATFEEIVPSTPTPPPPPELLSAPSPVPETMRSSLYVPFKKLSSRGSSVSSCGSRSGSRSRTATPVPPPPRTEETVPVWVSHIESPTEFYAQLKAEEDQLQSMSLQLNETLKDSGDLTEVKKSEIKEGMNVAAVFSDDGLWYRAEVTGCHLQISPAYVTVVYVDYGNSENVPLTNITKLPPGMEHGPFYAHKCLLRGIQPPCQFSNMAPPSWSAKAITHFKNTVDSDEDKLINVVVKEVGRNAEGYREVDLFTVSPDGSLISVAHKLVQMGLAARLKSRASSRDALSIPPPLPLPKSRTVEVIVSSSHSPSDFYIQLTKDKKPAKNLTDSLKKLKKQKVYFAYRGLVCMAGSHPHKMKRAVITDVSGEGEGKTITVQCVDYGTEESVKEVWELDPTYIFSYPALATHCRLHNLQPVLGSVSNWPQEVVERFRDEVSDTVLELKTCGVAGEPLSVELTEKRTNQTINSLIVTEGLARYAPVVLENHVNNGLSVKTRRKRTKSNNKAQSGLTPNGKILTAAPPPPLVPLVKPSSPPGHPLLIKPTPSSLTTLPLPSPPLHSPFVGQTLELIVVQVNSPGEFYTQSPTYNTHVQPILGTFPPFLKPKSEFDVGEMCLAPFQGKRWFRGKVDKRLEEGFEISYVDFGNQGVVPAGELTTMPPSLQKFPPQALKAELAGVLPLDGGVWGMDSALFFSNLVLDKSVATTVQAVSNELVKVHVNVEGHDVGQTMLLARMARPDPAFFPLPPSSCSTNSVSASSEGEGERGGEGGEEDVMNRLGRELVTVATVLNGGVPQEPLNSPSPNPPPSPPTVSVISPVNPVSPDGPPPPCKLLTSSWVSPIITNGI